MRKLSILILLIITFTNCSKDDDKETNLFSGTLDSVNTFGGSKNESAKAITKTTDGGFAVLGYTQSNDHDIIDKPNTSYDYWVLKFDKDNQLQWSKTYGGSDDDRGQNILQTLDNGFLISGYSRSNDQDVTQNNGFDDFWIVKLNESGSIVWEKSFGFSGNDRAYTAIQTNDGGYLITGIFDVSASGGLGNDRRHAGGDFWAIKLDASGNKLWRNYYGGSNTDAAYGIAQTNDGGFILIGSSDSSDVDINNNKGSYDLWVIKINNSGTLDWEKSFGGSDIDEAFAITATNDGNYIIVGDARSNDIDINTNNGSSDIWALKINDSGTIIWKNNYGGSQFDAVRAIYPSQNGGFYLTGNSRSSNGDISTLNKGQNDVWVLKISSEGDLKWQKSIGGNNIDLSYGITELSNNTIVIVGESWSNSDDITENKGFSDALVIKIK